jgi:hypothetical protein
MPITLVKYPVSVRNDGIHVILFENNSFYNKVHIEHVEALEKIQYNRFNAILVSYVVVDLNAKVLMNLL